MHNQGNNWIIVNCLSFLHYLGIIAGALYGVAKAATLIPVRVLDDVGEGDYE